MAAPRGEGPAKRARRGSGAAAKKAGKAKKGPTSAALAAAKKAAKAKKAPAKRASRAKTTRKKSRAKPAADPGHPKTQAAADNQSAGRRGESVEIDLRAYQGLLEMHCTDEEAAGVLGITTRTLERRRVEDPEFAMLENLVRARGRMSLKRVIGETALMANDPNGPRWAGTMAIWKSKQPIERGGLGWSDRTTADVSLTVQAQDEAREDAQALIEKLAARHRA